MKRKDVDKIINTEQLISYCLFEDRDDATNEMVIKKVSGKGLSMQPMKEQQKLLVVNTYMIMKKRLWITLLKGCVL